MKFITIGKKFIDVIRVTNNLMRWFGDFVRMEKGKNISIVI